MTLYDVTDWGWGDSVVGGSSCVRVCSIPKYISSYLESLRLQVESPVLGTSILLVFDLISLRKTRNSWLCTKERPKDACQSLLLSHVPHVSDNTGLKRLQTVTLMSTPSSPNPVQIQVFNRTAWLLLIFNTPKDYPAYQHLLCSGSCRIIRSSSRRSVLIIAVLITSSSCPCEGTLNRHFL